MGGGVTILMGVVFLGAIPALQKDTRLAPKRWTTWLGAPLLGGVFALGWTPCLGPTLAAIVSISAGTEGMTAARGALLIVGYCLGLGLPFLLVALVVDTASGGPQRRPAWLREARTYPLLNATSAGIADILDRRRRGAPVFGNESAPS